MIAVGMNVETGKRIGDIDHIGQSIRDILITPAGSRLMRRDYGSLLFRLIDQPTSVANTMRMMAATVIAIGRWEPRVVIDSVRTSMGNAPGQLYVDLEYTRTDGSGRRQAMSLNVPLGAKP